MTWVRRTESPARRIASPEFCPTCRFQSGKHRLGFRMLPLRGFVGEGEGTGAKPMRPAGVGADAPHPAAGLSVLDAGNVLAVGDPKASRVLLNQPGEERQDVLENDPRLGVAARHHYHFATTLPKRTNQRRNREARANCGFSATSRHGDRGRPVADDSANQSTLPRQDRKPLPDLRALRDSEAAPEAGLHRSLNRSWVLKPKSVWRRDYPPRNRLPDAGPAQGSPRRLCRARCQ